MKGLFLIFGLILFSGMCFAVRVEDTNCYTVSFFSFDLTKNNAQYLFIRLAINWNLNYFNCTNNTLNQIVSVSDEPALQCTLYETNKTCSPIAFHNGFVCTELNLEKGWALGYKDYWLKDSNPVDLSFTNTCWYRSYGKTISVNHKYRALRNETSSLQDVDSKQRFHNFKSLHRIYQTIRGKGCYLNCNYVNYYQKTFEDFFPKFNISGCSTLDVFSTLSQGLELIKLEKNYGYNLYQMSFVQPYQSHHVIGIMPDNQCSNDINDRYILQTNVKLISAYTTVDVIQQNLFPVYKINFKTSWLTDTDLSLLSSDHLEVLIGKVYCTDCQFMSRDYLAIEQITRVKNTWVINSYINVSQNLFYKPIIIDYYPYDYVQYYTPYIYPLRYEFGPNVLFDSNLFKNISQSDMLETITLKANSFQKYNILSTTGLNFTDNTISCSGNMFDMNKNNYYTDYFLNTTCDLYIFSNTAKTLFLKYNIYIGSTRYTVLRCLNFTSDANDKYDVSLPYQTNMFQFSDSYSSYNSRVVVDYANSFQIQISSRFAYSLGNLSMNFPIAISDIYLECQNKSLPVFIQGLNQATLVSKNKASISPDKGQYQPGWFSKNFVVSSPGNYSSTYCYWAKEAKTNFTSDKKCFNLTLINFKKIKLISFLCSDFTLFGQLDCELKFSANITSVDTSKLRILNSNGDLLYSYVYYRFHLNSLYILHYINWHSSVSLKNMSLQLDQGFVTFDDPYTVNERVLIKNDSDGNPINVLISYTDAIDIRDMSTEPDFYKFKVMSLTGQVTINTISLVVPLNETYNVTVFNNGDEILVSKSSVTNMGGLEIKLNSILNRTKSFYYSNSYIPYTTILYPIMSSYSRKIVSGTPDDSIKTYLFQNATRSFSYIFKVFDSTSANNYLLQRKISSSTYTWYVDKFYLRVNVSSTFGSLTSKLYNLSSLNQYIYFNLNFNTEYSSGNNYGIMVANLMDRELISGTFINVSMELFDGNWNMIDLRTLNFLYGTKLPVRFVKNSFTSNELSTFDHSKNVEFDSSFQPFSQSLLAFNNESNFVWEFKDNLGQVFTVVQNVSVTFDFDSLMFSIDCLSFVANDPFFIHKQIINKYFTYSNFDLKISLNTTRLDCLQYLNASVFVLNLNRTLNFNIYFAFQSDHFLRSALGQYQNYTGQPSYLENANLSQVLSFYTKDILLDGKVVNLQKESRLNQQLSLIKLRVFDNRTYWRELNPYSIASISSIPNFYGIYFQLDLKTFNTNYFWYVYVNSYDYNGVNKTYYQSDVYTLVTRNDSIQIRFDAEPPDYAIDSISTSFNFAETVINSECVLRFVIPIYDSPDSSWSNFNELKDTACLNNFTQTNLISGVYELTIKFNNTNRSGVYTKRINVINNLNNSKISQVQYSFSSSNIALRYWSVLRQIYFNYPYSFDSFQYYKLYCSLKMSTDNQTAIDPSSFKPCFLLFPQSSKNFEWDSSLNAYIKYYRVNFFTQNGTGTFLSDLTSNKTSNLTFSIFAAIGELNFTTTMFENTMVIDYDPPRFIDNDQISTECSSDVKKIKVVDDIDPSPLAELYETHVVFNNLSLCVVNYTYLIKDASFNSKLAYQSVTFEKTFIEIKSSFANTTNITCANMYELFDEYVFFMNKPSVNSYQTPFTSKCVLNVKTSMEMSTLNVSCDSTVTKFYRAVDECGTVTTFNVTVRILPSTLDISRSYNYINYKYTLENPVIRITSYYMLTKYGQMILYDAGDNIVQSSHLFYDPNYSYSYYLNFRFFNSSLNLLPGYRYFFQVKHFLITGESLLGPRYNFTVDLPNLILNNNQSRIVQENFSLSWSYDSNRVNVTNVCRMFAQNGTFITDYECTNNSVKLANSNEGFYVLSITYWTSEQAINQTYNFTFLYDKTPPSIYRYYFQTDYPSSFSLYFQCDDNSDQFYQSSSSNLNKCYFFYDIKPTSDPNRNFSFQSLSNFQYTYFSGIYGYQLNFYNLKENTYNISLFAADLAGNNGSLYSVLLNVYEPPKFIYDNVSTECLNFSQTKTNYRPQTVQNGKLSSLQWQGDQAKVGCVVARTWQAYDVFNQFSWLTQYITVSNVVKPTFKIPIRVTVQCSQIQTYTYNLVNTELTRWLIDKFDCGQEYRLNISDSFSDSEAVCGTSFIRTYIVTDNCFNKFAFDQEIVLDGTIDPISPRNNGTLGQKTVYLQWPALYNTQSLYRVYVWKASDLKRPFYPQVVSSSTYAYMPNLQANTYYNWQVVFKSSKNTLINGPIWAFYLLPEVNIKLIDIKVPDFVFSGDVLFVNYKIKNIGLGIQNVVVSESLYLDLDNTDTFLARNDINGFSLDQNTTREMLRSVKISEYQEPFQTYKIKVSLTFSAQSIITTYYTVISDLYLEIRERDPYKAIDLNIVNYPVVTKSESIININYTVKNNYYSNTDKLRSYDIVYLTFLDSNNLNYIVLDKIYNSNQLAINDQFNMSVNVTLPRTFGKYFLNIFAQSYQYLSTTELFSNKDTRRKYSTIEIQQSPAYYCRLQLSYFNLNTTAVLNKYLSIEYKLANIGNRTQCNYGFDLIRFIDQNSNLIYTLRVANGEYLAIKNVQLKLDFNIFKAGTYMLQFYGDYLNDYTDINENSTFKASNYSFLVFEQPQDLYVLIQNFTQLIDLKPTVSLNFDIGNLGPNFDSSIASLDIAVSKQRREYIYKESIVPGVNELEKLSQNLSFTYNKLLSFQGLDSSYFDTNLILDVKIQPFKTPDQNFLNNNFSLVFKLKKYAPQLNVTSVTNFNQLIMAKVPFNLTYKSRNVGLISSKGYQWYDVFRLVPVVNNQYDFPNQIFLAQVLSESELEYEKTVSLYIDSNIKGQYALDIRSGINSVFISPLPFLINVEVSEFNLYPDLAVQSFTISLKSINSIFSNVIRASYQVKNVAFRLIQNQWLDKIELLDSSNSTIFTQTLANNRALDTSEEYSNNFVLEINNVDVVNRANIIRLTLDSSTKINPTKPSPFSVLNISLTSNLQGEKLIKNVGLVEFNSSYEPDDVMMISYSTTFTSNRLTLNNLFWKDSLYLYPVANCTDRNEIMQRGVLLYTYIQNQPVYENYSFKTSYTFTISKNWNNREGFVYVLNDINKAILGSLDSLYSNWLDLLSPSQIVIQATKTIDLAFVEVSYAFLNEVDLTERYKYMIEFNVTILNNGSKSTLGKEWPLTLILSCENRTVFKHDLILADTTFSDPIGANSVITKTLRLKITIDLPDSNYSLEFRLNKNKDLIESNYENNQLLLNNVTFVNMNRSLDLAIESVESKNEIVEPGDYITLSTKYSILSTNQDLNALLICVQYYLLNDASFETSNKIIKLNSDGDCNVLANIYVSTVYTKTSVLSIPSDLLIGKYKLGVQLSNGQLTDSDPMNNRFVLDTPLSLTARFSLSIDTVYEINNSTLSGFYAKLIEVPAEKSILIDLDYNGSEPIVYTSFEKIPTQFDFELRSVKNINKVNSVRLTIPTTLNGTYYFYFWSETASFQLNIKAYYPSLQITKISPNQIYLNGASSLSVSGYKFSTLRNLSACLTSAQDLKVTFCTKTVSLMNNLHIFAKFDSVRNIQTSLNLNSTDFFFSLKFSDMSMPGELKWPELIKVYIDKSNYKVVLEQDLDLKSSRLIPNKPARLSLTISNLDFSDAMVPVYVMTSDNGTIVIDKFGPESAEENYDFSYEFIALNENFKFAYVPQQSSYKISFLVYQEWPMATQTDITFRRVDFDSNDVVFDDYDPNYYRPYFISSDLAWSIIFNNIKQCYGSTVLTVYPNLVKMAERMHMYGRATRSILKLIQFGVQINDGGLLPNTIVFETDLDVTNHYFKFFLNNNQLHRFYSPKISDRKSDDLFGFGWSCDWFDYLYANNSERFLEFNHLSYSYSMNIDGFYKYQIWTDLYGNTFRVDYEQGCTFYKKLRVSRIEFKSTLFKRLNKVAIFSYDANCDLLIKYENETNSIEYKYNSELDLVQRICSKDNNKKAFEYDAYSKQMTSISEYVNENLLDKQAFYSDCFGSLIVEDSLDAVNTTYYYDINFKAYYIFRDDGVFKEPIRKINQKVSTNEFCELVQKGDYLSLENTCEKRNNLVSHYNEENSIRKIQREDNGLIVTQITNEIGEDSFFNNIQQSNQTRYEEFVFTDNSKTQKFFESDTLVKQIYQDGSYTKFYSSKTQAYINITKANFDIKSYPVYTQSSLFGLNKLDKFESKIQNEFGETVIEYDVNMNPVRVTYPNGLELLYQYNSINQRTKLTSNNGYYLEYKYDTMSRLSGINTDKDQIAEFKYNSKGYVDSIEYANGYSTKYEYLSSNLIRKMINYDDKRKVFDMCELFYDDNYLITRVNGLNEDRFYTYDKMSRLVKWTSLNRLTNLTYEQNFAYDKASNMVMKASTDLTDTVNFKVGAMGKLVETDQGSQFVYDKKGNLKQIKELNGSSQTNFFYDFDNQFSGFQQDETACEYKYILNYPSEELCSNGVERKFLVDPFGFYGYDIIGIEENNKLSFFYFAQHFGLIANSLNQANQKPVLKFAHTDVYDNIVHLSDINGTLLTDAKASSFDPFGNLFNKIKSDWFNDFPFTYQGKFGVYEINNGHMYLFRVRVYNPSLSRFQSIDPKFFFGSQQTNNFYVYCDNSPINQRDSSGKIVWPIIVEVGSGLLNVIQYGLNKPVSDWSAIDAAGEFVKGVDLKGKIGKYVDLSAYLAKLLFTDKKFDLSEFGPIAADALLGINSAKIGQLTKLISKCGTNAAKNIMSDEECENASPGTVAKNLMVGCAAGMLKESSSMIFKDRMKTRDKIEEDPFMDAMDKFADNLIKKSIDKSVENSKDKCDKKKKDKQKDKNYFDKELTSNVTWPRSLDPNEILGPIGFSDFNFLNKFKTNFDFTIKFENFFNASAPARDVTVEIQLDAGFDINTIRLGPLGFGNNSLDLNYTTSILNGLIKPVNETNYIAEITTSIDYETRYLRWKFVTLDPTSLTPIEDVDIGFLPPNVNNSGIGEGYVSFRIELSRMCDNLCSLQAQANIFFDLNSPILTNKLSYIIDIEAPMVNATYEEATAQVLLNVSERESGVEKILAYLKNNASDKYELFASYQNLRTVDVSAFKNNSVYEFMFVGQDNVGNVVDLSNGSYVKFYKKSLDVNKLTSSGQLLINLIVSLLNLLRRFLNILFRI